MSKKRLSNLLKRKFSALGSLFSSSGIKLMREVKDIKEGESIRNQLREVSRFGGDLIVMRMGS